MTMTRRDPLHSAMAFALTGRGALALAAAPSRTRLVTPALAGASVTEAPDRFLDGLKAADRARAQFAFDDDERFHWHFIPLNENSTKTSSRRGVPLDDMTPQSKAAALDLMKSVGSPDGFKWCQTVMEREAILAELEPQNAWFRKPGWYFVTIYGKPAATGQWGWRLDGHHLSASVTVVDGQIVSVSPFFIGLNPVTVMHGKRKGERNTITPAEDLARELFRALDAEQQKVALQPKHLPEVAGRTIAASTNLPLGLSVSKMTPDQQKRVIALVAHYTGRTATPLGRCRDGANEEGGHRPLVVRIYGRAGTGQEAHLRGSGPSSVHSLHG